MPASESASASASPTQPRETSLSPTPRRPHHGPTSSLTSHSSNLSTRPMLPNAQPPPQSSTSHRDSHYTSPSDESLGLGPPVVPFASQDAGRLRAGSGSSFGTLPSINTNVPLIAGLASGTSASAGGVSLSVNYLPSKFGTGTGRLSPAITAHESSTARRRKLTSWKKKSDEGEGDRPAGVPKRGGGVEAFRAGEPRLRGEDEDEGEGEEDWVRGNRSPSGRMKKRKSNRLVWNRFKWSLFVTILLLTLYSLAALITALLIFLRIMEHSETILTGNMPELVLSTVAACLGLLAAVVGWAGLLLNNRAFLAIYSVLLWAVFVFMLAPGYLSYKRETLNLEGKINAQWSRSFNDASRLRIQNELQCCGYFSPFVEASISATCYARSMLPGCKLRYLHFERALLQKWYTIAFSLVPVHILVILASILCSNHVTYRFGKGMMPERYRLDLKSMAVIMDNYASQLAEHYGSDVASEVLKRSRSNLNLPYDNANAPLLAQQQQPASHGKYDSVGSKAPEGVGIDR